MATLVELAISLPTFLLAISIPAAAATTCENLLSSKLRDASVTVAQSVPAGSFKLPGVNGTFKTTPAFCRVAVTLKPSSDLDIRVEVWLPSIGWNGKFQGLGNGGFAGAVNYQELAMAISKGYTAAATDTGHQADASDAQWALNLGPPRVIGPTC
jgi:feruloyl esterase